jgi:hypothetical protein
VLANEFSSAGHGVKVVTTTRYPVSQRFLRRSWSSFLQNEGFWEAKRDASFTFECKAGRLLDRASSN